MFGLFGGKPFIDQELGTFHRSSGYWKGVIRLPRQERVPLLISGNAIAPEAELLALVRDLPSKLSALTQPIQHGLFEHYEPYRDSWKRGEMAERKDSFPDIQSEAGIWQHVSVAHVLVESVERVVTIEIGYTVGWDEEHTVGAQIRNGELINLCGSVRRRR
jgi:hypothetical protein